LGGYGSVARFFDDEYDGFRHDVDFYIDRLLTERVRGPVLEPGCGTGRVAAPLAAAGFRISGFDHSEAMLRRARCRRRSLPADARVRLRFSRQDMTSFRYRHRFKAVIVAFSTFNLLPTETARRACLHLVARHLEPGGLLLADLFNPHQTASGTAVGSRRFASSFRSPRFGSMVSKTVEESDDPCGASTYVRYRYEERRRRDDILIDELEVEFTLARLQRAEVEAALFEAGFDVEAVHGDYNGRPFIERSPRMIFQARRLSRD